MSNSRGGFVLLEAIAALMIVSVTGIAVLAALGTQMRASESAHTVLQADALARDRLARLELLDEADLSFIPDSLSRGQFAPPLDRFSWHVQATRTSNERGLFDVNVTIEWDDGRGVVATRFYRPERNAR
ncbi:MAG: type IV pilus modification PilV family protein [Gemmatimonadota bacterium]